MPDINAESRHDLVDEAAREKGLKRLRMANFQELIGKLRQYLPTGAEVLDVGCAHGWFIEQARDHFRVMGVEPDEYVARQTAARGLPVRGGFFPDVLEPAEAFDAIVFNDVFEHIPDVRATLASCRAHLADGGLLLLNLPSSSGMYYKLSRLFSGLGWRGPFERMWQKSLPSPHLHYFNAQNLGAFLAANGFEVVSHGRLPTVRLAGLYDRIVCAEGFGKVGDWLVYLLALASLPLVRFMPSDIIYVLARKPPSR